MRMNKKFVYQVGNNKKVKKKCWSCFDVNFNTPF